MIDLNKKYRNSIYFNQKLGIRIEFQSKFDYKSNNNNQIILFLQFVKVSISNHIMIFQELNKFDNKCVINFPQAVNNQMNYINKKGN